MKKLVAYYRVSTSKQGLGLEAQRSIVKTYAESNTCTIISEFQEKESGKETSHRAELAKAIAEAKKVGASLIVAKLDRLSRDVADTFALYKQMQRNIIVCDMDASDTLMLGIFASLAQKERELISKRTREALEALKDKGVKLGNPNLVNKTQEGIKLHANNIKRMSETHHNNAVSNDANRKAYAVIKMLEGSLQKKADYLNENGFATPRGGQWTRMQVSRLINMMQ